MVQPEHNQFSALHTALDWAAHYPNLQDWDPIDAFLSGRLRMVATPSSAAAYTWLRIPYEQGPMTERPTGDAWDSRVGVPWIVDVVGRPGSSGIEIGRAIRQDIPIGVGEPVFFWRSHRQKYGFARKV